MDRNTHRTNQRNLAVILCTAGVLAVSLAIGSQLLGQVGNTDTVIYEKCRNDNAKFNTSPTFSRDESCGIDEEAMRLAREDRNLTEKIRQQIQTEKRVLTPAEEERIDKHLEQQFIGNQVSKRKAELDTLLQTTATRLEGLLSGQAYEFTTVETKQLQAASALVASLSVQYSKSDIDKRDISNVRDELAPLLTDIHVLLTQKKHDSSASGPKVENLVTRIDALVARVGTVIRDLELSDKAVPTEVRSGHQHALQLVRQAKRSCSTTRPAACSILSEVLTTIEEMRAPLCKIDSPLLSFC